MDKTFIFVIIDKLLEEVEKTEEILIVSSKIN